jgi:hypothetical protein
MWLTPDSPHPTPITIPVSTYKYDAIRFDRIWNKGLVTRAISCAISCPIYCKSQMRFGVSAIWCRIQNCYRLHVACDMVLRFAERTRTPNRRYTKLHLWFGAKKKIGSKWFLSDTKSQIHQIASAICSKSYALNRSCNQALSVFVTHGAAINCIL